MNNEQTTSVSGWAFWFGARLPFLEMGTVILSSVSKFFCEEHSFLYGFKTKLRKTTGQDPRATLLHIGMGDLIESLCMLAKI